MIKKDRAWGDVLFRLVNGSIFILFTLLCVFPFYYIFINTISSNELAATGKILFLPKMIHFENYVKVLQIDGLARASLVSLARTVIGSVATLVGSSFLGYAFSRKEMWKRSFWYRFIVVTMYFNAGIIPWFVNMKNLGFINNFWAYVIPTIVVPFYIILFKTFIESIPASLEESAQIDGAGYITRYIKIIIPLALPIIATIAVFSSVRQWNAFIDTLFLMTKSKYFTLQFKLYQYLSEVNALAAAMRSGTMDNDTLAAKARELTPTSIRMTISIVVVIPILFVYPVMQKYFVKGIMIGAVKG